MGKTISLLKRPSYYLMTLSHENVAISLKYPSKSLVLVIPHVMQNGSILYVILKAQN